MKLQNLIHILIGIACIGLLPGAQAVVPPPDGGYPGNNTAEGDNALFSLTTGVGNTGLGGFALYTDRTGEYNTAVGVVSLLLNQADFNTAVGSAAMLLNATGTQNTAVGADALFSNGQVGNRANFNGAFGYAALYNNFDGFSNNAFGDSALFQNQHGAANTAMGDLALSNNDVTGGGDGNFNTAVGAEALLANTDGSSNNAVGYQALTANTAGLSNNAMGVQALNSNDDGDANVAIGDTAMGSNVSGSFNTMVGDQVGLDLTSGGDNIYIGATAGSGVTSEDGTIRIGDPDFVHACFIAGIRGQTASGGVAVFVDANGKLGTVTSSARFKDDIKSMDKASEALLALKPVTFHYKKAIDPTRTSQFGLVAEEVEKVNPDLVVRDKEGKPYTVRYEAVNAMLLNEFLKEHHQVQDLKTIVAEQQKQIEALTAGLQKVSAQVEASKSAPQMVNNP